MQTSFQAYFNCFSFASANCCSHNRQLRANNNFRNLHPRAFKGLVSQHSMQKKSTKCSWNPGRKSQLCSTTWYAPSTRPQPGLESHVFCYPLVNTMVMQPLTHFQGCPCYNSDRTVRIQRFRGQRSVPTLVPRKHWQVGLRPASLVRPTTPWDGP